MGAREQLIANMTEAWRKTALRGHGNTPEKVIATCADVALGLTPAEPDDDEPAEAEGQQVLL